MTLDEHLIINFEEKYKSSLTVGEGVLMDSKLVTQFIIFLIVIFGWTVIILLLGCK